MDDNMGGKSHEKNRKFIRRFIIGIVVVLLVIVVNDYNRLKKLVSEFPK